MDDILILRVENCVDKNIVIMASYERSCYGMSLEELVSIPIPVRATKLPSISSNVSADGDKIVQANESVYDSSGNIFNLIYFISLLSLSLNLEFYFKYLFLKK